MKICKLFYISTQDLKTEFKLFFINSIALTQILKHKKYITHDIFSMHLKLECLCYWILPINILNQ